LPYPHGRFWSLKRGHWYLSYYKVCFFTSGNSLLFWYPFQLHLAAASQFC
jgi:hypothetical protein